MQFLAGNDAAAERRDLRQRNARSAHADCATRSRRETGLVIVFGSELRGGDVKALVNFGLAQGAKFICLGDYANSRGAADMGLYPDMLPGYAPVGERDTLSRRVAGRDSQRRRA